MPKDSPESKPISGLEQKLISLTANLSKLDPSNAANDASIRRTQLFIKQVKAELAAQAKTKES